MILAKIRIHNNGRVRVATSTKIFYRQQTYQTCHFINSSDQCIFVYC